MKLELVSADRAWSYPVDVAAPECVFAEMGKAIDARPIRLTGLVTFECDREARGWMDIAAIREKGVTILPWQSDAPLAETFQQIPIEVVDP